MSDFLDALHKTLGVVGSNPTVDQRGIARALGHAMVETLARSTPNTKLQIGSAQVSLRDFGQKMIDDLWPADTSEAAQGSAALRAEIDAVTDPETQRRCCDLLARLGHMHQMAGLLLRDLELEEATSRTTAEAFLEGNFGQATGLPYTHVANAVSALNKPWLEFTFTAHPTNTNSLSSMIAQREISKALHAWRKGGPKQDVEAAFMHYANAPLLPERKNAPPGLSVRDEVQTMLYFLNNTYTDLDRVYAGLDSALSRRFKDYNPADLRLSLKYNSWGSSADKDGNANVNADTTLYALAAHHQQILQRYKEALSALPGLNGWKEKIARAQEVSTNILRDIETVLNKQGYLSEMQFDQWSGQLKSAVAPLDKSTFMTDLLAQPPSPGIISLARHVHTFGFSFGTLEYRETAEEFTRIIATLIPDYPANEMQRRGVLSAYLSTPDKLRQLQEAFRAMGAAGKPYSRDDVGPIAYHTRKRLELARDFPSAIDNQVLAECQDTSNLLEILLLQHATADAKGTRPRLGIVPLFEDSGPLDKAPDVLRSALADPHYRAHLKKVAALQHTKPTQQMQLAHSDNARRNGLPAARALIYRAHQRLRTAMEELNKRSDNPTELQFYEGGSLSDPYRGGVRAVSAAINEYGLHNFSKMTVQGGDLLNYFNQPSSIYRLLMRNVTHSAARLEGRGFSPASREEHVIDALTASGTDYKQLFHSPELNDFLTSIGFAEETRAGNTSSRAGHRPNGGVEKVDATKARTISFSEGFQHAGLTPTWIGSLPLPALLKKHGIETQSPRALQQYYRGSPVFKDVIDRMLFGLVRSDIPYLRERSGNHPLMQRFEAEYGTAFKLCMEAYMGKSVEQLTNGKPLDAQMQHAMLIREVYPHVASVFADQDRFTGLARHIETTMAKWGRRRGILNRCSCTMPWTRCCTAVCRLLTIQPTPRFIAASMALSAPTARTWERIWRNFCNKESVTPDAKTKTRFILIDAWVVILCVKISDLLPPHSRYYRHQGARFTP